MLDLSAYLKRLQAGEKGLNPIVDYLEMKLEEVREGYARMRMPFRSEYLQASGYLQGGLMVALADEAIAHAMITVLDSGFGMTTIELKCNFLAHVTDSDLFAEATVFKKGRTLIIGDCLVKDARGKDVLRCTATFLTYPEKKDSND